MSKKHKKRKDIFDQALQSLLVQEEDPFEQDSQFEWDSFDIAENLNQDERQPSLNEEHEDGSLQSDLSRYAEDISEEDFDEVSSGFLNNVCEPQKKVESRVTDDIKEEILDAITKLPPLSDAKTPSKSLFPKKAEGKKNDLFSMERAILNKAILIRHDGGLYYFNGKCYSALRSDLELLELVRKQVSTSGFDVFSTRPFQDLMLFLKTDPSLVSNKYEKKLERAQSLVALNNGVLDISSLTLLEFDPKYLLFHSIDASWSNRYPKTFMRFIRQACAFDEEVVRLTLEVIGYMLSGSNRAKAFFVIGTAPDSGKSTLAALIQKLIGETFTCSIEPHKLAERFSLGASRGKILNLAMDIPRGKLCSAAVSRIKAISGSDSISIEEKYQRVEHTTSALRFLFGTNFPITLSRDSNDPAFWNRMHVIPFTRTAPPNERDPRLLEKLWEERDEIVSLCLRNYKTVMENGYHFSPCRAAEDLKASWQHDDPSLHTFAMFWSDFVEVTGDESDIVLSQDLYDKYFLYCHDRGIDPVYYTKIKSWIEENADPQYCTVKRIRQNSPNPRAVYCGIKIHYEII